MTAISHIVDEMMRVADSPSQPTKVEKSAYEQWARGFVFEGLRNKRYGQSFCNHFNITDNILYFSSSVDEADRYIQKNYLL